MGAPVAVGSLGPDAVSYASLADLYALGAPEKAFGQLTDVQKLSALESASLIVDTYLRGRYSLPLLTWDFSITEATCRIAAYNALSVRGFNPAVGGDANVRTRYEDSLKWLDKVQRQQAHPDLTPQPNNSPRHDQPFVITSSVVNVATGGTRRSRGW